MSRLPPPAAGVQPGTCPTCHGTGELPDPFGGDVPMQCPCRCQDTPLRDAMTAVDDAIRGALTEIERVYQRPGAAECHRRLGRLVRLAAEALTPLEVV